MIDEETRRRITARRSAGEDIGHGLELLIRQDVETEVDARRAAQLAGARSLGESRAGHLDEDELLVELERAAPDDREFVDASLDAYRSALNAQRGVA